MNPLLDFGQASYFLRMGASPQDERVKTLAIGVKVFKSKDPKPWGFLSFFDQLAQRHRVIELTDEPEKLNAVEITCKSDIGDVLQFQLVTKDLWDRSVKGELVKTSAALDAALKTTEEVQDFLLTVYP
ncbi:hypothetical protein [Estrella lausannensis]|uniref:Uncharacterized protein n=1 Tax=Estrella lausannensis TaxID=483423 RepID=A0A0H5DPN6_9BACT|nr:hypothetical protein [Estrella lausannensis]CRX37973.1 Conserved hypothetical protein [Estrella lausannensis]